MAGEIVVTMPVAYGLSGRTYSSGDDPATGFGDDGHETRFPQALEDVVGALDFMASVLNTAVNSPGTLATSTSELPVVDGLKTFTVEPGKVIGKGQFYIIAHSAAPTVNYMVGQVVSYNDATGEIQIDVSLSVGGGTYSSWVVSLTPGGDAMRSAGTGFPEGTIPMYFGNSSKVLTGSPMGIFFGMFVAALPVIIGALSIDNTTGNLTTAGKVTANGGVAFKGGGLQTVAMPHDVLIALGIR